MHQCRLHQLVIVPLLLTVLIPLQDKIAVDALAVEVLRAVEGHSRLVYLILKTPLKLKQIGILAGRTFRKRYGTNPAVIGDAGRSASIGVQIHPFARAFQWSAKSKLFRTYPVSTPHSAQVRKPARRELLSLVALAPVKSFQNLYEMKMLNHYNFYT
jgi:hypothetical protein